MSKKKDKDSNILSFFFELQINIKTFHWLTKSYRKHKVSDKLFEKIIEKTDDFIEVYIGKYGRPKVNQSNVLYKYMSDDDFEEYLKKAIKYLEKDIFKYISQNDTDLLSIRDDFLIDINQTIYLLSFN